MYVHKIHFIYLYELYNRLELHNTAAPIDFATGQLNQHELTASKLESNSESQLSHSENIKSKRDRKEKEFVQLLEDGPTSEILTESTKTNSKEKITNIEHSTVLLTSHSAGDNAEAKVTDATPQLSDLKKGHSYEDIELDIDKSEPKYDDVVIVSTAAAETNRNNSADSCLDKEHRYHILCDPNTEDLEELETKEMFRESSKTSQLPSSTSSQHYYEDVNSRSMKKRASQDQYNVLSSGMEPNPFHDSIVQEDINSPNEDQFYSTARGHRLVPVGKPIPNVEHMYEILGSHSSNARHSRREVVYYNDNLVRSFSVASRSLERLDPMYDEPFKGINRSNSLPKVNIYDMDSLFDDPKYQGKDSAVKGSKDKLFDDPSYCTRNEARRAAERHVSITVEPQEDKKSSYYRPAASRKTK